ncbi:MAG: Rrf2 family transcriptional regulator [Dehalococcoidia bacterium]|nr:Rrf2 family transcriptional regulator [Dehalococcoidia bacterium]
MKLSTRARYGTRALLDLALYGSAEPVPLRAIAKRQQISLTYLEHVVTPLITSGILRSVRGSRGGVALARPAQEIKLLEVIHLLEGSTSPVECISDPSVCSHSRKCVTRDLWAELQEAMDHILEATTLADLVERQRKKDENEEGMYYI